MVCAGESPLRAISNRQIPAKHTRGESAVVFSACKLIELFSVVFVLYGCETWSLTLKEECRLRVFENRVTSERGGNRAVEKTT